MIKSNQPIGIFDSGIGGLTLVRAIHSILPDENIIYFGDTVHMPYGDKSQIQIQNYSQQIVEFLLTHQCKLILIACNSASAAAFDTVKLHVDNKVHVLNVIDPVINYVKNHFKSQTIGLIGTRSTVNSGVYQQKIEAVGQDIVLKSLATPLLALMIEEGFCHNRVAREVISEYLSSPKLNDIGALILGCTHYPLIKKEIDEFYKGKVEIIDSSMIVAETLKQFLINHQLLNIEPRKIFKFYLSDYTDSFVQAAQSFFKGDIHFEYYPLWS